MIYWITASITMLVIGCAATNVDFNQKDMIDAAYVEPQTFEYVTSIGNDTGYTLKELTLREDK